jgi:predicted RecA/RadA family phage recombinase
MTVIAYTEAQVALADPADADTFPVIAAADIIKGQLVYLNTSGKYGLALATTAPTLKQMGVALSTVAAGQPLTILRKGHMAGYTVTALAYGALVYASDTAGAADTAAGTVSRVIGSIVPKTDPALTKLVYFDFNWLI